MKNKSSIIKRARSKQPVASSQNGFTLIELLTVIAIIGVLMAFLTFNFLGVRTRARDGQRKSDIKQIQSALELYRADNGSYPPTIPSCASAWISGETYMQKVPCDPKSSASYYYAGVSCSGSPSVCTAYSIASCIENTNDKDAVTSSPAPGTFSCTPAYYYVSNNP